MGALDSLLALGHKIKFNGTTYPGRSVIALSGPVVASVADDSANDQTLVALQTSSAGATGDRPASPSLGQMYFDTTLGKPIWWKGSVWVKADGTNA